MFRKPKYLLVTALFIVASLALTACGGATANASNQEDAPKTGASVNESDVVEVQITLNEFSVKSSETIFEVGVPYRFTIVNNGMMPHELMLIPQLDESITGVKAGSGMEPGAMMNTGDEEMDTELMEIIDGYALAVVEEDDLFSGATASFDYTFTEPSGFGELELSCYVPGHYEAGMFLPIMVQ